MSASAGGAAPPAAGVAGSALPADFVVALNELGLARSGALRGEPLAGGVSSDIWRVDTDDGPVCVKRALSTLRVAADWQAPIERNVYEARWLQVANAAVPGAAPEVLGQHERLGVLVMRYLSPNDHRLWKNDLRDGVADVDVAGAVGTTLARIHAFTAARSELAAQFATDAIFFAIRLDPYLLTTGCRHPELAPALAALVEQTRGHKVALVHGDVSPKNIVIGPRGPVFLDAECAWWGDPAFDLAFCLNHLLLKCLWTPAARDRFLACFEALAASYLAVVDWEPRSALEGRAARLLPGLLLARVDGKSPVEYLRDDGERETVRRVARRFLLAPAERLQQLAAAWREELAR
jgi:aminoglycoside phosphotransferase (APT) family kinase protein